MRDDCSFSSTVSADTRTFVALQQSWLHVISYLRRCSYVSPVRTWTYLKPGMSSCDNKRWAFFLVLRHVSGAVRTLKGEAASIGQCLSLIADRLPINPIWSVLLAFFAFTLRCMSPLESVLRILKHRLRAPSISPMGKVPDVWELTAMLPYGYFSRAFVMYVFVASKIKLPQDTHYDILNRSSGTLLGIPKGL